MHIDTSWINVHPCNPRKFRGFNVDVFVGVDAVHIFILFNYLNIDNYRIVIVILSS